ncbi:MAG: antibiotic biosynthesis monooxygenase [Thermoflexaceae bacterium]|jgi:quinol monooxygenase YgiN|nr:antibiotic biosynthesis monooxygenase [Thermoflexaceae bacterium]
MLTIVAKLQAAEGKADELKAILLDMVGKVKENEAGAVPVYSLHESSTEPGLFLFYEQYRDADALAAHGKTEHMAAMNGSLKGLLGGRPVIERYVQVAGVS